MHQVNVRGTYLVTQAALPYLIKARESTVLVLSPPLPKNWYNDHIVKNEWLAPHLPYTLSKYSMSILVAGWSAEFKPHVSQIPKNNIPSFYICRASLLMHCGLLP